MSVRKCVIITVFMLSSVFTGAKDLGHMGVTLFPWLRLPVGSSREYVRTGGGGGLTVDYALPKLPFLTFRISAATAAMPIVTADALFITSMYAGPGFNIELPGGFGLSGFSGVGYFFASVPASADIRGGNLAFSVGAGALYSLPRLFSFGVSADYLYNRQLVHSLGITISSSVSFRLKTRDIGPPLVLEQAQLDPVFPILHQHYDTSPVGILTVKNNRDRPVHNIGVDFMIDRYMSDPKTCISALSLDPGETTEVPVYALFDSEVLEILESTKVSGRITFRYVYRGKPYTDEYFETVSIENRNATVWDDDRKVAAFVNTLDPDVMTFAKIIDSFARQSSYGNLLPPMKSGIAIFEALRVYDMRYAVDAATPFEELSENPYLIDYLQFPRQTLQFRAGDCDDLSILYNALLQSASVHTAFITVPGHIFPAISLEIPPEEAKTMFSRSENLIFDQERDTTWIPVEITALDKDFLGAWEQGAREWREADVDGAAQLIPTEEAWKIYQPVWYRPVTASERSYFLELPDVDSVKETFNRSVRRYVLVEVEHRTEDLLKQIEIDHRGGRLINKLGVIYARFGMIGEARKTFSSALAVNSQLYPALVNLGNIAYLDGDYQKATELFERAEKVRPGHPKVMVTLIELYYESGKTEEALALYAQFSAQHPDLAQENRHLSSQLRFQTRASRRVDPLNRVFWMEEER